MEYSVKKYCHYLLHANKRMYLIIFAFLCMIMPCMVFVNINAVEYAKNAYVEVAQMLVASGCVLSFVSPIYFFRHIFWKRSADMYFGLPMDRKTLFKNTFLMSVGSYLIPLYIAYYAAVVLCVILGNTQDIGLALVLPLMLSIIFVTISCIVTWIVSFSNSLLDAIVISGLYFLLPYLFCSYFYSFLNSIFQNVMVGDGSYIYETVFHFINEQILVIWEYAIKLTWLVTNHADYRLVNADPVALWPLIYWAVIGVIAWFGGYHFYTKRKQEQSEQRTNIWCGYSLLSILVVVIMSLTMFTTFDIDQMILVIIIIFCIYNVLLFLAQRTMKLRAPNMIVFLCIILCCFGFSQAMIATKAFHSVEEELRVENLDLLNMEIFSKNESTLTLVVGYDKQGNAVEKKVNNITIYANDEELMEQLIEIQKETVISNQTNVMEEDGFVHVFFHFNEKNNRIKDLYRFYDIKNKGCFDSYQDFIYKLSEKQAKKEIKGVLRYSIDE